MVLVLLKSFLFLTTSANFFRSKNYGWCLAFSMLCSASPFQLSKPKQNLFLCLWLFHRLIRFQTVISISCNDLAIFQERFNLWINIGKKLIAELYLALVRLHLIMLNLSLNSRVRESQSYYEGLHIQLSSCQGKSNAKMITGRKCERM